MGGYGSGRSYHLSSKDTTSDYRSIDVRYFKKQGLLKPNQSYSLSWSRNGKPTGSIYVQAHLYGVSLKYKARVNGDDWADRNDLILIDWTGTNFGGERPWFICPASGCGKRVAKLYGGRAMFACRHCLDLAYESQRESDLYRAIRHVDKLREKLGWEPGFLNGRGWTKPKGMHQKTFDKLLWEYDKYHGKTNSQLIKEFNLRRV